MWLADNIKKLDVFKAANRLFEGTGSNDEKTIKFDIRLLEVTPNTNTTYTTDKHIFLPFIQTLDEIIVKNNRNEDISGGKNQIIEILNLLRDKIKTISDIINPPDTSNLLSKIVDEAFGIQDVTVRKQESFYHGVLLGITLGLKGKYKVKSNRESGRGLYDIALFQTFPRIQVLL